MTLYRISCRAEYDHRFERKFNIESWCVAELYWRKLKDYDTRKVKKCIINVSDNWKEKVYDYTNWSDNKGINMPFDFTHYFGLGKQKKKMMLLEIINQGMMKIAEKEGWETDSLLDAYNKCLEDNLEYKFTVGKLKTSPDRKHKINFWCIWDIDIFEIYWVLCDKNGEEIRRERFIEREPYEGEFIYYVDFKWVDRYKILLVNKYKYGHKEHWEIDLSEYIKN